MSDIEIKTVIATNISDLLATHKMTKKELADKLGVSDTSISNWCNGSKVPRMDKLDTMAELFGVNRDYFFTNQHIQKTTRSEGDMRPFNPTHKIPILGRISAGLPIYADEHIEGYTYTELNGGAEYFALRVTGDSMTAARINDGDLLIVRRQDMVENGEIAVVMVGDADATVKRFYKEGQTVTLMPQSTNPIHRPQVYNLAETRVRVLGRVVKNEISY